MQKMGWFGRLMGTQGHRQCHHSIERIRLPIRLQYKPCVYLYRFRGIAGYLWKVADSDPPHLHLAPMQGVTPVEFRRDLLQQKTRVSGLSCGVVCVILRLAVLVEHRLLTDGQTDGRTQGHGQYRIAYRGKKLFDQIVNKPEHCLHYLLPSLQANSLSLIVSDLPTNCRAYLQRLTDSKTLLFVIS